MNLLDSEWLARLATLTTVAGMTELDAAGLSTSESATQLAETALNWAEANPANASHLLALARVLSDRLGTFPALRGQIDYAQARIYLQMGNLTLAETALRAAQSAWNAANDNASLSRSRLGLAQILTLQGRYVDAEVSCRTAIAELRLLANLDPTYFVLLCIARNNLTTQLIYQERHFDAVAEAATAQTQIADLLTKTPLAETIAEQLRYWLAVIAANQATALLAIDHPNEAEANLTAALEQLQLTGDALTVGRVQSNLGSLFARTGRYADALRQFDSASQLLLGENAPPAAVDLARSELLLDRATTYLALNLLSEAGAALERCEQLYRNADQPYELAQSLLLHGLLRGRFEDFVGAQNLLNEAERLFAGLQNLLWQNRTSLALATVDAQLQNGSRAIARLDALLTQPVSNDALLGWDIATLTEVRLLRLRLHLQQHEIDAARSLAAAIGDDLRRLPLPQFELRLQHAWGQIEMTAGNHELARQHLEQAIALLETQRSALPIEEVRTAFLGDKSAIYADLVLTLLESTTPQAVDQAFAVVERARSRALLERLLTVISATAAENPTLPDQAQQGQRTQLQQQLHWLYNRLLNDPGSRRIDARIDDEIRSRELALQQLEWQQSPHLLDAQPTDLATLQSALAADQQALVYFIAGDEVMVFFIDAQRVHLQRQLCSNVVLQRAQQEWRFQLGRAEIDPQYLDRHATRFEDAWRLALNQLYALLIAPIAQLLSQPRLLIIPYGSLHLLPFHGLWNGSEFLLQRYEIQYAPSGSLAVRGHSAGQIHNEQRSFVALAITNPAIPAARAEVEAAAQCFSSATLFIDEQATRAALQIAARSADVLHLATHGLFRPDNAFFSALKLADGWVDVRQLYRLPLAASLVVLSACESGAGQVQGGDEVIGLARGFLGAGAKTVVASLWNVHDASSARLMAAFYGYLRKSNGRASGNAAAALRLAQIEAVTQAQHPYYWAAYFVIGS